MKNTVLGEIYSSFSDAELKLFDQYMSNSQWQYRETILKCHLCFFEYTNKDQLEELNKQLIFNFIYEDEVFNDTKLRYTMNKLVEAVKEFILLEQNRSQNVFSDKIWIDFLIEKKLRKNIQYNLEKNIAISTSEYRFLSNYFKSQEENFHSFNYTKDTELQYSTILGVMKSAEAFSDLVFIKNYCSLITFSTVYKSLPIELPLAKLKEIQDKKWEDLYPEFLIYSSFLNLLISNSSDHYYSFKSNLFENFDIWNHEEKGNFLAALLNFTSLQINKGNVSFIDEQYDLYNYFEETGIFLLKSYLNPGRINNVVFIYLKKKEFQKAEDFVNKYVKYLNENLMDSCRHFNLARIYFENTKYKGSLQELLQVDFSQDAFYSLNSKIILLKNYYELKESDAFDSLCSSFKEFIRKNKVVSETAKLSSLNFIKIINKLYGATPSKLKKTKLEIEASTQLIEKNWLLAKC